LGGGDREGLKAGQLGKTGLEGKCRKGPWPKVGGNATRKKGNRLERLQLIDWKNNLFSRKGRKGKKKSPPRCQELVATRLRTF